jgi:hypothetical protein
MILKHEQKKLKRYLGPQYSNGVLQILERKGILNKNGKPHSASYVRMVFQGLRQNQEIEAAIWELASFNKQEFLKRKQLKNQFFNSD